MEYEIAYTPIYGKPKFLKEYTLEKTNLLISRIDEIETKVISLFHVLEEKRELQQSHFLKMNELFLEINLAVQESSCVFNNLKPVCYLLKSNRFELFPNFFQISLIKGIFSQMLNFLT